MKSTIPAASLLLLVTALPLSAGMNGGGKTSKGADTNSSIAQPHDPAQNQGEQTAATSPDLRNFYSGTVVLDSHGEAWVSLPSWFETQNRDFSYQLTAIGAPAPNLYIAQKISGNRFKIAGGRRGMEVSWQVTSTRQEARAVVTSPRVEKEKPAPKIASSRPVAPNPPASASPMAPKLATPTSPSAANPAALTSSAAPKPANPSASVPAALSSTSAPPATPAKPSVPSVAALAPPSEPSPAALTDADIAVIKDILERQFKGAFESRSMSEMQKIWPDMPRVAKNDIASLFQSSDVQDIRMDLKCLPAVSADRVLAYCSQTFTFSLDRKAQAPLQLSVIYRLRRTGGRWHLEESRRGLANAPRGLSD